VLGNQGPNKSVGIGVESHCILSLLGISLLLPCCVVAFLERCGGSVLFPFLCAGQNDKTVCVSLLTWYTHVFCVCVCFYISTLVFDTNIILLYHSDFSLPHKSSLVCKIRCWMDNWLLYGTASCCVTSPMFVIMSSAHERTTSQSQCRQRFLWLISMQVVRSWPVPMKLPCHSPLAPYFPKMAWRRGGKSRLLIYIREGKKFFNQTGDDGGEQIKLKVIKASVLWSKLRP